MKLRPRPHGRQHDSRLGVNQRVLRLKNRHAVHSEFAKHLREAIFARQRRLDYHSRRAAQGSALSAMSVAAFGQ